MGEKFPTYGGYRAVSAHPALEPDGRCAQLKFPVRMYTVPVPI